jgi:hypothetical protein
MLLCEVALLASSPAHAAPAVQVPAPPVDLGETSILDGEAGAGGLLEIITQGYAAPFVTTDTGGRIKGTGQRSDVTIIHAYYASPGLVLGAYPGMEILLPVAAVSLDQPRTSRTGLGDFTITPLLQWSDISVFGHRASARLGLSMVAPSGQYSSARLVNLGLNAWQASAYWAYTWHLTPRWSFSGRAIYDWSSANMDPPRQTGLASMQAGSLFAMDFATSWRLDDHWRAGIAGYALRQLDGSRVNGRRIARSEQQVLSLGPVGQWSAPGLVVRFNGFREFDARNRPQGWAAVARLLLPF